MIRSFDVVEPSPGVWTRFRQLICILNDDAERSRATVERKHVKMEKNGSKIVLSN